MYSHYHYNVHDRSLRTEQSLELENKKRQSLQPEISSSHLVFN